MNGKLVFPTGRIVGPNLYGKRHRDAEGVHVAIHAMRHNDTTQHRAAFSFSQRLMPEGRESFWTAYNSYLAWLIGQRQLRQDVKRALGLPPPELHTETARQWFARLPNPMLGLMLDIQADALSSQAGDNHDWATLSALAADWRMWQSVLP